MFINKRCNKCHNYISNKKIIKAFISNKSVKCNNCDITYKITSLSRVYTTLLVFIPILIQNKLISIFGYYSMIMYIVWIGVILVISPLLLKFET